MNTPFLKMTQGDKRKLAISEIVILVIGVIGLLVVIWVAWVRPDAKHITSFKECVAAGNAVHQSYPEVCVTGGGQQFTNPAQHVQAPGVAGTPNTAGGSGIGRPNVTQLLIFTNWKVQMPFPVGVGKLSATQADDDTYKINLDDIAGDCKGTNMLRRATATGDLDGYAHTPAQVKKLLGDDNVKQIGGYYYVFVHGQAGCTDSVQVQQQINTLSAGFQGANIQNLTAQ